MPNLAMYLRISIDDEQEGDSESILNQRMMIENYIKSQETLKTRNVIEYTDDGYSGKTFDRPSVKRLFEDIKKGDVDCVIVKDLSRFGRNYVEVGVYLERIFPSLQIRFISINDNHDSINDNGASLPLDVSFKLLQHDFYIKDLSSKISKSMATIKKTGKFTSPHAIYGYKIENDPMRKLVIDEESAVIVRQIYDKATQGASTGEIARELNKNNTMTPSKYAFINGGRKNHIAPLWSTDMVKTILKDLRYTGIMTGNRTRNLLRSNKYISIAKDEWIIVKNTHEEIIEKSQFDFVQKKFETKNRPKTQSREYLLKSLLVCSSCGYKLRRSSHTSKSFTCSRRKVANKDLCDNLLLDENKMNQTVTAIISKQIELLGRKTLEDRNKKIDNVKLKIDKDKEKHELLQSIQELEKSKYALYRKYSDEEIEKEPYQKENRTINEAIRLHKGDIMVIDEILSKKTNSSNSIDLLSTLDINNELAKKLIEKIIVHGNDEIEVVWKSSYSFRKS